MEIRKLICIGCPLGCMISVEMDEKEIKNIAGYTCPRGKAYAEKEVTNPMRIVTTSVRVTDGKKHSVPVKTKCDIPKEKIFDVMRELKGVTAEAPIKMGDVLVKNVAKTGVDIVATATVNRI